MSIIKSPDKSTKQPWEKKIIKKLNIFFPCEKQFFLILKG